MLLSASGPERVQVCNALTGAEKTNISAQCSDHANIIPSRPRGVRG